MNEVKLAQALRSVGDDAEQAKIEAQICNEINKEKHLLQDEFAKKVSRDKQKRYTPILSLPLSKTLEKVCQDGFWALYPEKRELHLPRSSLRRNSVTRK